MQHLFRRLSNLLAERDSHIRELLSSGSTAFFLKIGSVIVVYFFQFMVAKIYGSEGNGLFSFCYAILNILMIVSMLGLETYLIRFIADYANKKLWGTIRLIYRKALFMTFLMAILLGGMLYFTLPTIMETIDKGDYSRGLQITAIALIPAAILRLNAEALRGLKQIKYYSLLQNITILTFAMIGIAILELTGHQKENILWGLLIGEMVVLLWSFYLWRRQSYTAEDEAVSPVSSKEILRTSIPLLLASTIFFLMNWTDKIMLGFLSTQAKLGVYEVAIKISQLGNLIIFAINTIAAPKFSEFYSGGKIKQFQKFTQQTTLIILLTTLPVILIILLIPGFLLGIFGETFITGKVSLILLTIGAFFSAGTGSVIIILNMTGKQKTSQFILLTVGIMNVLLNYLLIPRIGIEGAAMATMISTVTWNLAAMVAIYRYYGFWTVNFKNLLGS